MCAYPGSLYIYSEISDQAQWRKPSPIQRLGTCALSNRLSKSVGPVSHHLQLHSFSASPNSPVVINSSLVYIYWASPSWTCSRALQWLLEAKRTSTEGATDKSQPRKYTVQARSYQTEKPNCLCIHKSAISWITTGPGCSIIYPLPISSPSSFYSHSLFPGIFSCRTLSLDTLQTFHKFLFWVAARLGVHLCLFRFAEFQVSQLFFF